jgi:hypothetical protein
MTKRQYNFGKNYNGYAGWPHTDATMQKWLQVFRTSAREIAEYCEIRFSKGM